MAKPAVSPTKKRKGRIGRPPKAKTKRVRPKPKVVKLPKKGRAVRPRAGGGKPRFEPSAEDKQRVEQLAGFGLKQDEICVLVKNPRTGKPIDGKTLRLYFAEELDRGTHLINSEVIQSLYQKATGDGTGAVTAAIWWTKCRAGWKERIVAEVEIKSGVLVPPAAVTPEEWIAAAARAAVGKKEPGAKEEE